MRIAWIVNFVEALSAIDRAIGLDGAKPHYLDARADILLHLEQFEEAIGAAQSVLDTDPDHWHSLIPIIPALVRLGRLPGCRSPHEGFGPTRTRRAGCATHRIKVLPVQLPVGSGPRIRRQSVAHRRR